MSTEAIVSVERQLAIEKAHAGYPLSAIDLALIFDEGLSNFYKKAKRGAYDDFLLKPPLGPHQRYSGVLVSRYLRGDVIDAPGSRFGKRKAS